MTTITYWHLQPRGFSNEYIVGIADNEADADQYNIEGYRKIERDEALALMSRRAEAGEGLEVDAQLRTAALQTTASDLHGRSGPAGMTTPSFHRRKQ